MESVYYKNLGSNKCIYDVVLKCLQNRERSFSVAASVQPAEIMIGVMSEHPELYYVAQLLSGKSTIMKIVVCPSYVYSDAEILQISRQLDEASRSIIRSVINDHQSEYDKVCALHDYLKSNIVYDKAALGNHNPKDRRCTETHSIVGALLRRKCVCEGFAKALKYLCDKINLECWVVNGTAKSTGDFGPHAWNIVKINGYYHHVDVTWDNQRANSADMPNYAYMNLSDEEIARDHIWNRKNYPQCPSSPYNYFRVNNSLVDSKAQLESMLYRSIQMEEASIMFRVIRGSILEREINDDCIVDCVQRAADRCKHIGVRGFRYGGIAEQLTFCIKPEYYYE